MLTTPATIRTLQRKLYRKAKQEPAYRFYALYDKIYRADILSHAYHLVRANKGSAGIDGITFEAIEENEGVTTLIVELEAALRDKTYKPDPVKRVLIPKKDGSQRPLGIPTIRDRVVQMAAKLVIEPIFEADFCDTSYGFRPKKSAHDAIDDIVDAMFMGHNEVIDADISKYFDTIPHANLMATVAERICDGEVLRLIQMWLKAPIMRQDKDGTKRNVGGGKGSRTVTPQGGVISPLLSNLYLHILDRIWERNNLKERLGARIIRYADDMVILCKRGKSDRAMTTLRQILERLKLSLNETKTKTVNAHRDRFDFLGFSIYMGEGKTGKLYPHVEPSKKSLKTITDRVTELTRRERTVMPLEWLVNEVNSTVRGWVGYFHYRNCSRTLAKVKRHVEQRLITHLRKRHKIGSMKSGYVKFPRGSLYAKHGLYKVPTSAGWMKAHASQRRTSESRVRENRMHGLMRGGRVKPVPYSTLFDGYYDEDVYFHNPSHFVPNINDPKLLDMIRNMQVTIAVGEADSFLENNLQFREVLREKGIQHSFHIWSGEAHRARYWREMAASFF